MKSSLSSTRGVTPERIGPKILSVVRTLLKLLKHPLQFQPWRFKLAPTCRSHHQTTGVFSEFSLSLLCCTSGRRSKLVASGVSSCESSRTQPSGESRHEIKPHPSGEKDQSDAFHGFEMWLSEALQSLDCVASVSTGHAENGALCSPALCCHATTQ